MCSIIGYRGADRAAPILVRGLRKMEYRGYDSVGVATVADSGINLRKGVGRVDEVNSAAGLDVMEGNAGIGHTRWATHGGVSKINAHPHQSNSGNVALVHNGIIENHAELKSELESAGYEFASETDTEVLANLLQQNYTGDARGAMISTLGRLQGSYAFVAIFEDGTLAAARHGAPLIVGVRDNAYYPASDVLGFIGQTDEAVYVKNGSFVIIDGSGMGAYDYAGESLTSQITKVSKELADAYKGQYAHYTLKEIFEQPQTIMRAGDAAELKRAAQMIRDASAVYITGSGTSYNAALAARYIMSALAGVKVDPVISSEMPHGPARIEKGELLIALSQSGESADVIRAASIAKKSGASVISMVNMRTSQLALESDHIVGMNCGPEIGVAATKSFTSQLAAIYSLADILRGKEADLAPSSDAISHILEWHTEIQRVASQLVDVSDIYVLGRGVHYPLASEAALKLKELAYVHAEGIPGGELKHGPLALMDPGACVIIINPDDSTYADTMTSASEIKARKARIIGVSDKNSDVYDEWIRLPSGGKYPITEIVPLQLLAYYLALEKDADPDHPRNLAKSVTVR